MNRDRVRCSTCREYDHFANEYLNTAMDNSDGYDSDRAALQLITTDAEIHQNSEGTRPIEEQDYLLIKGKHDTTSFLPLTKKGGPVRHDKSVMYIPDKEQRCLTED